MKAWLAFFLVSLPAFLTAPPPPHLEFIVWNVGQGSWATLLTEDACWHFDMGGEKNPLAEVARRCSRKKKNLLFLSHWDLDHISFIAAARKQLKLCLAQAPGGDTRSKKKKASLAGLPDCSRAIDPAFARRIPFVAPPRMSANESSHIFLVLRQILVPGDSTSKMERLWAPHLPPTDAVKVFLLGHHGSKTSNSELLFEHLPKLAFTIASARKAKYGHPHPSVLKTLRERRLPVISTEDWGHIHLFVSSHMY